MQSTSELQRSDLSLQNLRLEQENRRLKREFEISDRRVSELARELTVIKEREKKGIEWYEDLIRSVRVLKDEKAKTLIELCEKNEEVSDKIRVLEWEKSKFVVELDGLRRENEGLVAAKAKADEEIEKILEELCEKSKEVIELRGAGRGRDEVDERIRVLEREKSEFEVELDGLRRENEGLVAAKVRADEEMEKMRRDLEDEIKGLRGELCEKYEEICDLKCVEVKNECVIKELFKRNEGLESELGMVKRKVGVLEMEKGEFKAKFDELCRENERLVADVKEKDERVEELKRKVEDLEIDKCVIMNEKDEASKRYEEVEERLLKVEEDVANWLLENVPIAKKVMGDQVVKVLSSVLKALDSEQDDWTDRVEDVVGRDFVGSHLNEAEAKKTSSLETKVLSDTEVQRVNGTIGVKRDASLEVVVLSDSDSDNEDHSPLNELKRPRVLSQCWNQSIKLENCSQNSSCKFKQHMDLPSEDSELKASITAAHRSDKFVTSKKQEVAPLRQCKEISGDKVKEPMSCGTVDDVSSQRNDLKSPQANVFCSRQCNETSGDKVKELIATCRRKLLFKSSKGFCIN